MARLVAFDHGTNAIGAGATDRTKADGGDGPIELRVMRIPLQVVRRGDRERQREKFDTLLARRRGDGKDAAETGQGIFGSRVKPGYVGGSQLRPPCGR